MDESSSDSESLSARIHQLENERDELHKDIEQLCMQKAGPSYVGLATQIYFRRTAGLEQEVENLKKKLSDSTKENSTIKEELSEAKRIKTHLDQLHKLEVERNTEVVKQLDYWCGIVANAFADRDHAIVEAEKAKENEELLSQKLDDTEKRLLELHSGSIKSQEQVVDLQTKLKEQELEIENLRKVTNKFYMIRQHACGGDEDEESELSDQSQSDDVSWDEKCACLYNDPTESWSFNVHLHKESSSADYIATLEEELETLRGSVGDLQNKLRMGLEIEKHLKKRITFMEQKKILSDRLIIDGISALREYHSQQRIHIMELLNDEKSYLQSVAGSLEQKIGKLPRDISSMEKTSSTMPNITQMVDSSEMARALQEKVSALILLSQQEERHIWEKNVQAAVQETVDELQIFLKMASAQKVKALMELAEIKQKYELLVEENTHDRQQDNFLASPGERRIIALVPEVRLKNLLKKTSLRRWLSPEENIPAVVRPKSGPEASSSNQRSHHGTDDGRLRVEYITLKDSIHSLERMTFDVRKLRVSLMQAKMKRSSKAASNSTSRQLDEIIREGEMLKTALSSALPLSWSGEGDMASDAIAEGSSNHEHSNPVNIDPVSAAGLEMVELVLLAAQAMKGKKNKRDHIK